MIEVATVTSTGPALTESVGIQTPVAWETDAIQTAILSFQS